MKSVVRPELPTASAGSSQAPTAAVDNSAPVSTHPEPTYKSGKAVQTTETTSGASGLVGYAGVRHFAKLDGWEVVAVSRRTPAPDRRRDVYFDRPPRRAKV